MSKNTVYPDEIILVASNITTKKYISEINEVVMRWNKILKVIKLFIRKPPYNRGEDKNFAAENSKYDYIGFLDVKDAISVYKVEFSKRAFIQDPTMDMTIHGLSYNMEGMAETEKRYFSDTTKFRVPFNYKSMRNIYLEKILTKNIDILLTYCCDLLEIKGTTFHNNYIVVKKKVWESLKFIEDIGAEDTYFNTRAILGGVKVGIFSAKLVIYSNYEKSEERCIRKY